MKKLAYTLIMIILYIFIFSACSKAAPYVYDEVKMVKVKILEEETLTEKIKYFGMVESDEVKTYSFKTGGRVEKVNLKEGDRVINGDTIMTLDGYDYNLNVKGARENIRLAEIDLSKAKDSTDFIKNQYEDSLKLFESGSISKNTLDEVKLKYDNSENTLVQSKKKLELARINFDSTVSLYDDTLLLSDIDGYVVEILKKEGEIVSQGYPVAVIRSGKNIVKLGISIEDLKKINKGHQVEVIIDGESFSGKVIRINSMPDMESRKYDVEIDIESDLTIVGESCQVIFDGSKINGIWIDINSLMNDGSDYVYVVEGDKVKRVNVEINEMNGFMVRISNLSKGEKLILEGHDSVGEGSTVIIEGDKDE